MVTTSHVFTLGCTGSRGGCSFAQERAASEYIAWASDHQYRVLRHGDCQGADAMVYAHAKRCGLRTISHPPSATTWRAFTLSDQILEPRPYLERNHDIVDNSDYMLCLPDSFEQKLRSGTWSTIRYAQRINRPGIVVYPDGSARTITDALV